MRPSGRGWRRLRILALSLAAVFVTGVVVLGLYGLPAPPAITTDGMPRISWAWVWNSFGLVQRFQSWRRFAGWLPGDQGMLVHVGSTGTVHVVDGPGAAPRRLEGLPDRARFIVQSRITERPYFVFSLDEGGSERYRHYRFDLESGSYEPITSTPARSYVGQFDGEGRRVLYASTGRNQSDFDIYIVDVTAPGSEAVLVNSGGEFGPAAFSPDGRTALIARSTSHTTSELFLLDVETRTMRPLLDDLDTQIGLRDAEWSRDGRTVYLATELDREFVGVHAFDPLSGRVTPLTDGLDWDVDLIELLPDDRTLALVANEDARSVLYLLDVQTGQLQRASNSPDGSYPSIVAHPTARKLAVDVISPMGISGMWVYDADTDQFTPWAVEEIEAAPLPPPRTIRYRTFDSTPEGQPRVIPAIVFPPADEFEGPRPVLIDIHGGPTGQSTVSPAPHYELIRRLGTIVIAPNVRGSRGYGRTFAALDDGRRREDAVRDIGALLDWIAAQPDLDASRIAVTGGSYGGYMTLATLVHYSDRVRCGFEGFGISDFVTFLAASQQEHFPESQRAEFGDERDPEMRAFLASISPARHAERIRVPLLIFQGANDVRVKPEESRRMVERIRAAGGHVAYIEASDEGHGLEQPLNQLYVGAAVQEFMARCLGG